MRSLTGRRVRRIPGTPPPSSGRRALISTLVLVLLTPLASKAALGAQSGLSGSALSPADGPAVDPALIAKAAAGATSRVIVGLRLPWRVEGLGNAAEIEAQRSAIAIAQQRLAVDLQGTGAAVLHDHLTIPFQVLSVTPTALGRLLTSDLVSSVVPDRLLQPTVHQSVPLIQADQAWALGYTGAGMAVAILDTGIEGSHTFLVGRVAAEACFSSKEPGVSTSLCPNGQSSQIGAGASSPANCAGVAGCDHGTHVAGIAAGAATPFSGVARGAFLIGVNVFSRIQASACGGAACIVAFSSDLDRGLEHVFGLKDAHSIAAVNMSLGGGKYTSEGACDAGNPSTKALIDNLRSVGIASVISSGNSSYLDGIGAPGCISSAVAVGSTTKQDAISSFSNSSTMVDLLAPGSEILSSTIGNNYGYKSGTSMAAPHVAGAWAILKQAKPTATVSEVLSALTQSGLDITDTRNGVTKPRIRVRPALDLFPPSVSIGAGSVAEGDTGPTTATFTVALSGTYPQTVAVDYATAAGTATAGTDFLAAQGTLAFPPGTTTRVISVSIVGDRRSEGDESFSVTLSAPVNATLANALGVGTIVDNDAAGFAVSDIALAESRTGSANAVFTVTLSPALGSQVTVTFSSVNGVATPPEDYTTTAGTLTFAAGETMQTISVPVLTDALAEAPETFFLDLLASSGPTIARSRGTATIYDTGLYSLTPCRVLDTRESSQGPALSAGSTRTVLVGNTCGVPAGATAVSLNVTVVSPTGAGDLRIFPSSAGLALVSTINYGVGQTRANNATLALSSDGLLSVFCEQASGTTDLIIDVNGFFP